MGSKITSYWLLVKKRIFLEQVVQDLEQLEQPVQEKKLGAPSTSIKKIKKLKGKFWTKNEEIKNSRRCLVICAALLGEFLRRDQFFLDQLLATKRVWGNLVK